MILQDIVDYLTTGGLGMTGGTNLFAGFMPSEPNTALAVYQTGGLVSDYAMGDVAGRAVMEHPRLQVVSRSTDYQVAHANAQKAYLLLDGMPKRALNGVQYHWTRPVQPPFLMHRDEALHRVSLAFNVDVWKELSTTS